MLGEFILFICTLLSETPPKLRSGKGKAAELIALCHIAKVRYFM